jgi:hypothetical protein
MGMAEDADGRFYNMEGAGSEEGPFAKEKQPPGLKPALMAVLSGTTNAGPFPIRYLAAAASNKFRNSNFFSAGRKEASKELRASSRKCSSVKPNVSWAS